MFFRLRPVNFPTARLAAFCFLLPSLFARSLLSRILGVLRLPGATPSERRSALISLFRVSPDRFWSRHYHFRGTRRGGGIALGHARVHELLVNSIVPLLLLYARVYTDGWVRRGSLALLRALPSAGENRLTRLVKAALIGGNTGLRSPVEQQGLLHLYSLYCSRGRCSRCPVRTDLHREKTGTPVEEARGFRMSRRCLPARMSRCSRR